MNLDAELFKRKIDTLIMPLILHIKINLLDVRSGNCCKNISCGCGGSFLKYKKVMLTMSSWLSCLEISRLSQKVLIGHSILTSWVFALPLTQLWGWGKEPHMYASLQIRGWRKSSSC